MQLRKEVVLFDLRFLPGHGWHVSLNLMYGHVGPSQVSKLGLFLVSGKNSNHLDYGQVHGCK